MSEIYEIILTTADGTQRRLIIELSEGDKLQINRIN